MTTPDDVRGLIERYTAKAKKARATIEGLCHGERWIMHVPVDIERDPDIVLSDALDSGDALAAALEAATAPQSVALDADDVEWVVNTLGELGVRIDGRCFFLYKGNSLEYKEPDKGEYAPMRVRLVGKREFGETCLPRSMNEKSWAPYTDGEGWEDLEPPANPPTSSEGSPASADDDEALLEFTASLNDGSDRYDIQPSIRTFIQKLAARLRALRAELANAEERADLHANLNRRAAEALGKPEEGERSSWHDIHEEIRRLHESLAAATARAEAAPSPRQIYDLCLAIEQIPASPEQTAAVALASSLLAPGIRIDLGWDQEAIRARSERG